MAAWIMMCGKIPHPVSLSPLDLRSLFKSNFYSTESAAASRHHSMKTSAHCRKPAKFSWLKLMSEAQRESGHMLWDEASPILEDLEGVKKNLTSGSMCPIKRPSRLLSEKGTRGNICPGQGCIGVQRFHCRRGVYWDVEKHLAFRSVVTLVGQC